jgi:hypothetical protein
MKIRYWLVTIFLLFALTKAFPQGLLERRVTIVASNISISQILDKLGVAEGVNFSYQSNLEPLQKKISLNVSQQPLSQVLSSMLEGSGLSYTVFANQVIIQVAQVRNKKILLEGRVCISGSHDPVSYAGIELKYLQRGTIADNDGNFRFEIDEKNLGDTLRVSSLNFDPMNISVRSLSGKGAHTVFLTQKIYNITPVVVNSKEGKFAVIGNHKWIPGGSLYIDTHGQQTALYIDNDDQLSGRIVRVSYFLSRKGNTIAPFRIRIYEYDSITGKPGTDMLPEILVVKPAKGKGWFRVNVSKYNLKIPRYGFFVALEGVFPDDYDFFYEESNYKKDTGDEQPEGEFTEGELSYGQRIGYTHGNTNHTWHYAIDRTWFQLKKGHFNVMISAEVKVSQKRNKLNIFQIFQKHEKNSSDSSSVTLDQ